MSKWTKFMPDGKGGYDAFSDWSLGNEVIYRNSSFLTKIFFGLPFAIVTPVLMLLIYPITDVLGKLENIITSIIISFVFLLDFWFGGPLWILFETSGTSGAHEWLAALHASLIAVNIILYFATPRLDGLIDFNELTFVYFIAVGLLIYFILFPIFDGNMDAANAPMYMLKELYNAMLE